MPRIDPQQLLSCLTPLLAVNGGIKSSGEVIRLANLMEKYSKKLVSKCIYIQILKCTETELLGQFMAANGWNLVHSWLNDGVESLNWPFVQEILEMLLLCPVDGNRLKSNHTPRIIKSLSMNSSQNSMITALSKKLVEQWLKIAHQEKQLQQQQNGIVNGKNGDDVTKATPTQESSIAKTESNNNNAIKSTESTEDDESSKKSQENIKYKVSNKESGLVISLKRSTSPNIDEQQQDSKIMKSPDSKIKSDHSSLKSSSSSSSCSFEKDKERDRSKKSSSSSSHKSSSSSSKSSSSHRDKTRSSSSSSSHKRSSSSSSKHKDSSSSSPHKSSNNSKNSSSSSSSSRDKDKDREKKKRDVEKEQAEKDKETLSILQPLSSAQLHRIPKRPQSENSETELNVKKNSEVVERKKPSISIEVRKGEKPKTVKTLGSQFRNHGLAEEPPPPPSRKTLKKPSSNVILLPPPINYSPSATSTSSHSTTKSSSPPPNKKIHLDKAFEPDVVERVGGVKLIKPKPMLVESTGFLDALDASAFSIKKDLKKRKRLPSGSSSTNNGSKKDEPESPKTEAKPLKFYKDTLEENADDEKQSSVVLNGRVSSPSKENDNTNDIKIENKNENNEEESKSNDSITAKSKTNNSNVEEEKEETAEDVKRPPGIGTGPHGPPGIIVDPNFPRKRTKRSIKWRPDEDLNDIHYFPLEENERINVTKTFTEQKQMEHIHERNSMLLGRKQQDEQTNWKPLILIDNVPFIQYGYKSTESAVQAERERNTLQDVFLDGRSMFDSPHEPDTEIVERKEPNIIPLEDVTGNTDSINNFRDVIWPAPKGDQAPELITSLGFGNIFNNISIAPNINIPPATVLSPQINPLAAGFNLGALQNPIASPHDNTLNFMGILGTTAAIAAPFMQPPPMIQNNYQSRGLNTNYSTGSNNSSSSNNNSNTNRYRPSAGGGNNSNWVRGNATTTTTLRRGLCHQYQRNGNCRNRNSCPYIHQR